MNVLNKLNFIKKMNLFLVLLIPFMGISQYTDVLNSNRPGVSVSAYAVGKNVIQVESGLFYEQQDHSILNTESSLIGADISLRYGLLFERLELNWESRFQNQNISYLNYGTEDTFTNFYRNRVGLKFLIYDRYKDDKPNLYSWRANNVFQLRNLIPSVSLYAGINFVLGDNPFYIGDPTISPRVMVATQSRLSPRFVLISNIAYDRIGTDYPELSYSVSISHAFRNPKWSVFMENQGIKSDRYSDLIFRSGVAHLFNETFQVDLNLGASIKNTPSRIFMGIGASYRFDFHTDPPIKSIEDQNADENGGAIKKGSQKKKKKVKKKKKGSGAEDVDLGPTKKQLRKLKKAKKKDKGVIDF